MTEPTTPKPPTPRRRYRPRTGIETLGGLTGSIAVLLLMNAFILNPALDHPATAPTANVSFWPSILLTLVLVLGTELAHTGLHRSEHRHGGFQDACLTDAMGMVSFFCLLSLTVLLYEGSGTTRLLGPGTSVRHLILICLLTFPAAFVRDLILRLAFPRLTAPMGVDDLEPPRG